MTRAILVNFRKYTNFGHEFYAPIFDFFVHNLSTKKWEFDHVYFLDSQWDFTDEDKEKIKHIKGEVVVVDPSLRYYDAFKFALPQVKEDLILLLDNDTIIYQSRQINETFSLLEPEPTARIPIDVVSIYDTIGEHKFYQLNDKSKFCPYWFATSKKLLMKYLDVDWGDHMPEYETLGKLTEVMLKDHVNPYEWEEDKSSLWFENATDEKSKDLGYYHIRAGSTPAYLLATKKYGDQKTYWDYINNQPRNEFLRQCAWYEIMGGNPEEIVKDAKVGISEWLKYLVKFKLFHGLE